ncbi:MAG: universal stress protein [Desulfotignum sp.]
MFKNFIVATDISPASFAVVESLSGLTAYGAEQCLLLQCLSFGDAASTALSYDVEPLKQMLNEQKEILQKDGFVVEARTVYGSPKQEINRIAAEEDYSLIVVGAQGHSLVEEKLLGGVAYGIINKTVKPVLVVPVEKKQGEEDACEVMRCSFKDHVLFATDFSEIADNAFTYVEQLVADGAGKVTLTHVQDKDMIEGYLEERLEELKKHSQDRLENLKQVLLKKGGSQVDIQVGYGSPFQEITRLVEENSVQLLVMGTQGRGFLGEFFLGSVSHNVARHSVAPVLLVPGLR